MYLGIDVGGTKTLVASLDDNGVITEEYKFPTSKDYAQFLSDVKDNLDKLAVKDFKAAGVGIPVSVFDRKEELDISFGNLPWHNVNIQKDIENLSNAPVVVDNDAKMAALSESMLIKDEYSKILYVTVSTGIGFGLVVDGKIDDNIGDPGGRSILLEHDGQMVPWESFASGKAIVERYGKRAEEITDHDTWVAISRDLAKGFIHLIAIAEPEVIVIGGSVGNYFDRFQEPLQQELENYKIPLVELPKLVQAQRPDQAVVYGCYDLAKQVFNHG